MSVITIMFQSFRCCSINSVNVKLFFLLPASIICRFPGSSARENWVRIIVDAVDYSREALKGQLDMRRLQQLSPKRG